MIRYFLYFFVIFTSLIILTTLDVDKNFYGVYSNNDLLSYLSASFTGIGYVDIYPKTNLAKFIISILCFIKYLLINEFVLFTLKESLFLKHLQKALAIVMKDAKSG